MEHFYYTPNRGINSWRFENIRLISAG